MARKATANALQPVSNVDRLKKNCIWCKYHTSMSLHIKIQTMLTIVDSKDLSCLL